MQKTSLKIAYELIPVVFMITLITYIQNDYVLTLIYIGLISLMFFFKLEKKELLIFSVGFVAMIFFEWLFVSTGVETFTRNTLFGIMPLWLPFLWAYSFVIIKRIIKIIETARL